MVNKLRNERFFWSLGFLSDYYSDGHFICHIIAVHEQIVFALFPLIKQSYLTNVHRLFL